MRTSQGEHVCVPLALDRDALIVLDDLLARWEYATSERVIRLESDAEGHALRLLHVALDRVNPYAICPGYDREVEHAQRRLIERWGRSVVDIREHRAR